VRVEFRKRRKGGRWEFVGEGHAVGMIQSNRVEVVEVIELRERVGLKEGRNGLRKRGSYEGNKSVHFVLRACRLSNLLYVPDSDPRRPAFPGSS